MDSESHIVWSCDQSIVIRPCPTGGSAGASAQSGTYNNETTPKTFAVSNVYVYKNRCRNSLNKQNELDRKPRDLSRTSSPVYVFLRE